MFKKIDEVRIYNRAWDVKQYNRQRPAPADEARESVPAPKRQIKKTGGGD